MIVKYGNLRFHRCDDTQLEDEEEISRPEENKIIECPFCGEGMQRKDWDNAKEE